MKSVSLARRRIQFLLLACCVAVAGCAARPPMAQASLSTATIVVDFNGTTIRSTSVTSIAIVTRTQPQVSYVECYFQTTTGQVGLRIDTSDQRRIEAFYQQIVTAAAGGQPFQITAYAKSTYQSNGYVANLDSDLVYLILS